MSRLTPKGFLTAFATFGAMFCAMVLPAVAQDNIVTVTTPVWSLARNVNWSDMNQVWVFRPLQPEVSLVLVFSNRNPTNSHSFTLTVFQTARSDVTDYTNNKTWWLSDTISGSCSPVSASSSASCTVSTMFSAQIAVKVTGAVTAAGATDQADLDIVLRPGTPGTSAGAPTDVNIKQAGGIALLAGTGGYLPVTIGQGGSTATDSIADSALMIFQGPTGGSTAGYAGIFPFVYNGATWDRLRGSVNVDAQTPTGFSDILPYVFNGTSWDRLRGSSAIGLAIGQSLTAADAQPNSETDLAGTTGSGTGVAATRVGVYPYAFNGSTWDRIRTCAVFKTATATASGNTALWTPALGKKFRLMSFEVNVPGSAIFATTAGTVTMTFQDAAVATGITTKVVQVPTTAVTGEEYASGWLDLGNGFLSAAANNALNINLVLGGTGALSGGVIVNACGTEE